MLRVMLRDVAGKLFQRKDAERSSYCNSTGSVDNYGLAVNFDKTLLFQILENPSGHFPRTVNNPSQLLAGNLDLHTIRMGHGIGFFAQLQQCAGDTTGHIQEAKIGYLLCSTA